jgi:hypothetical protein
MQWTGVPRHYGRGGNTKCHPWRHLGMHARLPGRDYQTSKTRNTATHSVEPQCGDRVGGNVPSGRRVEACRATQLCGELTTPRQCDPIQPYRRAGVRHGDDRTKWQGRQEKEAGSAMMCRTLPVVTSPAELPPQKPRSSFIRQKERNRGRRKQREVYVDIYAGRTRCEAKAHAGGTVRTSREIQFCAPSRTGQRTGRPAKPSRVHMNTKRANRTHSPKWLEPWISRHGDPPRSNPQSHADASAQAPKLLQAPLPWRRRWSCALGNGRERRSQTPCPRTGLRCRFLRGWRQTSRAEQTRGLRRKPYASSFRGGRPRQLRRSPLGQTLSSS